MKGFNWFWKRYYVRNPGLRDGFCSPMSSSPPKVFSEWPDSMSRNAAYRYCGCSDTWIFPPKDAILSNDYLHLGEGMMRNDLCVCGSGLKKKRCHSNITDDSALMGLWQKYYVLEREIQRQKLANNTQFVCKRGCNACCSDYFYISMLEFIGIKHHLLTFDKYAFRKACSNAMAQYAWLCREHPDEYKRLEGSLSLQNMVNDHTFLQKALPCPLLNTDGECCAYAARPFICRLHGISSAFTVCSFVERKKHSLFAPKPTSFLVNIEYSDELRCNVDQFQRKSGVIVLPRPAPLVYWLVHEHEYQAIYELAYSRSLSEFAERC